MNSLRLCGFPVEIRVGHLPATSLMHRLRANPFDNILILLTLVRWAILGLW